MSLPQMYFDRNVDVMQQRIDEAKRRQELNRPKTVNVDPNPERTRIVKDMVVRLDREVRADMAGKDGSAPVIRAGGIIREAYPAVFSDPQQKAVMGAMDLVQQERGDRRPHLERYQENANRLQEVAADPDMQDWLALTPPGEIAGALVSNEEPAQTTASNVVAQMQEQRKRGNWTK